VATLDARAETEAKTQSSKTVQTFDITIFQSQYNPENGEERSVTWREFKEELRTPVVRKKKDGPMFTPAKFSDKYRHNESVEEITMLALEFDHKLDLSLAKKVCAEGIPSSSAGHTTHSHKRTTDKNPKAEDRYRIFFPLKEPMRLSDFDSREDFDKAYKRLWKFMNVWFYNTADDDAAKLSQGLLLPAVASADAPYERFVYDKGGLLDWRLAVEWQMEIEEAEAERKQVEGEEKASGTKHGGLSVWDDYIRRADLDPFIQDLGAEPEKDSADGRQWHHPDSEHPGSVQELTTEDGVKLAHFRTHRFAGIPKGATLNALQLRTLKEYGRLRPSKEEWRKLARKLRDEGYGSAENNANGFRPSRFHVDETGVYVKKDEQDGEEGKGLWLCSPLYVRAWTRDENRENAGLRLEWLDRDGNARYWTMPRDLAVGDATAIQKELLNREFGSFAQWRGANAKFIEYLQTANPEKVVKNTSRIGWHNGAYILPDETIGASNGEETVLQSNVDGYRLKVEGTLEEWQENVARYCEGNSRLLFAASVAFAAPLLRPLNLEGGGFHFRSQSSKGKSTSGIIAGSIYGGGDPTLGFARTWRNTANALEATAEMHNDGLLILDELAMIDPKDAGNVAYMLSAGIGKGRMTSAVTMRRSSEWALMYISTGEISLAHHVATAGKKTRAGQEVRLIDLPADTGIYGVFENLHGFESGAKFSDALKQNAKTYYGAPLRAYLKELTGYDMSNVKIVFADEEKAFTDEAMKIAEETGQQVSGEVSRVASRFALVAFAGELASSFGITGWTKDAARDAALQMFKEWIANRGGTGNADEEKAVAQVRRFLAQHGSARFQHGRNDNRTIVNQAGFINEGEGEDENPLNRDEGEANTVDEGEREYCIFSAVFRDEVCAGEDPTMVVKALDKRGYLVKGTDGKAQAVRWAPSLKKSMRVYAVSNVIFEE